MTGLEGFAGNLLKGAAAFINIKRRTAWAILFGCAALIAAILLDWPTWAAWVGPPAAFAAVMALYRPEIEWWERWRVRRRDNATAKRAFKSLTANEARFLGHFYDAGGEARVNRNAIILELIDLKQIEDADPYTNPRHPVFRLRPCIKRAIKKKYGAKPDRSKFKPDVLLQ